MRHIQPDCRDLARSSISNECVAHLCRWFLPKSDLSSSCTEVLFYHEDNSFAGINPLSEFGEIQPLCSNSESNAEFLLAIPWSFLWSVPVFDPEPAKVAVRVVPQIFWLCLKASGSSCRGYTSGDICTDNEMLYFRHYILLTRGASIWHAHARVRTYTHAYMKIPAKNILFTKYRTVPFSWDWYTRREK